MRPPNPGSAPVGAHSSVCSSYVAGTPNSFVRSTLRGSPWNRPCPSLTRQRPMSSCAAYRVPAASSTTTPSSCGPSPGLLARRPGGAVGQAERRGEVERVDLLVCDLAGRRGQLEKPDVGLVPASAHDVRRAVLLEGRQPVDRRLLVDLLLIGRERQRCVGCRHVGEPAGARVDGVRADLVTAAITRHCEVDRSSAELEAVDDVDVVEAARLVVGSRRGWGGDRLEHRALEVVHVEAGVLGCADHDAAGLVVPVDPDRRVVGVAVVAGIVVVHAGRLGRGRDVDELIGGSWMRRRWRGDQRRDEEQGEGRESGRR